MKIIDTHSHIFEAEFDEDIDEVLDRARKAGITKILLPNIDVSSIDRVNGLSARYPDLCLPMMGLHPTSVTADWESDLEKIRSWFDIHKYVGVGEVGIDLYWDKTLEAEQKKAFEEQLRWSIEYNLPVSIHSRDAITECVNCVKNVGASKLRGVFHSFGGDESELYNILALGNFYLGINGVVTFKNSTLSTVLKNTDLSKIVIETDSPYLAPVPYRGKRNESSYCPLIINKLSEIYNTDVVEVSEITSKNASVLFGI